MEKVKHVQACRVCGSTHLVKYLDLGSMPLANNLCESRESAITAERFPLEVLFCDKCCLSQLSVVIDPEILFSHYTYRSSINAGYKKHCAQMAEQVFEKYKLNDSSFHVDIAGNDGALLAEFKKVIGGKVLNVDPAQNLVKIANESGVDSIAEFWNETFAKGCEGTADLITATNVFAHVDDISGFLRGVKIALKDGGKFILEFPYIESFINEAEFDTIYFEHLSYLSLLPIWYLCETVGLSIIDIQKFPIHGGTLRVTMEKTKYVSNQYAEKYIRLETEQGLDTIEKYFDWSAGVEDLIKITQTQIKALQLSGNRIAAFAASAKGNTLLNSCGFKNDVIEYIIDETPEKIGKFSPGTGIEIFGLDRLRQDPPDFLLILSWNFKDEIIAKVREFYKGAFIIPIPSFEIIA